jgi:isocitrate dehydrogenase
VFELASAVGITLQMHRSPGFMTSNLIGQRKDGVMIKEFEASHGTVADLWEAHLRGEATSLNPLGMVEALIGAMQVDSLLTPHPPFERSFTKV